MTDDNQEVAGHQRPRSPASRSDRSGRADQTGPAAPEPAEATGPAAPGSTDSSADADASTADFVTFVVEGETYAFPMERVQEIIRMPETVRVPLGPPSLEGLANLRGRVLPIVSLRRCCGLPDAEHDEATRVIVVDGGATLGFVVDRVASVTSVDVARVEPGTRISAAADSELLAGLIKPPAGERRGEGEELTKVLDVARLVSSQFAVLGEAAARVTTGGSARTCGDADRDEDDDNDNTLELVSFAVDGQEYALPIHRVQEIVQAPERVTTIPNVESRVLGVMDLRGRLLPVIGLRQVFGLEPAPLEPQNRIVVVQLPGSAADGDGEGPSLVGVVMDTVREVLRVPHDLVADLPEFMARAGRAREVQSVCRLEEGRRLVSVLSVEQMFARSDLREALREAAGTGGAGGAGEDDVEVDMMRADAGELEEGDDELLVVFRVAAEEYSVDVDAVQEIIRVPETLIRVPKALDFVEGLVNLRGAVLPVVDLRTRLGLERIERDERQRIVVLIVNGVRTGFIVDSVLEVLPVTRSHIEPAPELSAEQARLVKQVANLAGSQRMLMLLEPDQLLATSQLMALVPQQRDAEASSLVG